MRCIKKPAKMGAALPEGCLPQPPAYHQVVDPHRHPAVTMEHLDSSFER